MPLSWNEIKGRAVAFAKEWAGETSERAEAQSFWNAFFGIFGIDRKRVAAFEKQVSIARASGKLKDGRIDAFWKGVLLIEHKSAGQKLDRAFAQAVDYFDGLAERDLPRYVLVSDFARLRLVDFETGDEIEFALVDLHKHIRRFGFIAGYQVQQIKPQDPVNLRAAERMGKLHDALEADGYEGHALEVLLVRLLFCLFADDTGIFQPAQAFRAWVEERTAADGSDLGPQLAALFQVLNTPDGKRPRTLDEQLAAFPYVNGALFAEHLPLAAFDASMRERLLDACAIDWSTISPAIFGALFQSIMKTAERRNLGAHYTSEENIQKLIKPLFLDALWAEFHKVKSQRNRLFEFHKKLRGLNFLDPACGCGNFLVITYRELRLLELEVLRVAYGGGQREVDVHQLIAIDVDQFHGIEIEEFPVQVAQVALWLIDHQMNLAVSEEFGQYFARIPLKATPHIVHGNALRIDWADVVAPDRCAFVLGNPPFVGSKLLSATQRGDASAVFQGMPGAGLMDFVAAWYVKAARFMREARQPPRGAFVSTNSITQGEQVVLLWGWLLAQGIRIHFAHRTFQWSNEARGVAAVHCVIVGFGVGAEGVSKTIYEYEDIRGEPHAVTAANINPYLVDAPDVLAIGRTAPIGPMLRVVNGSIPADGGHLILDAQARAELLAAEPEAGRFVRPYVGAEDFIQGLERWCLWLVDCPPTALRKMPIVLARVQQVRLMREASAKAATRGKAAMPTLFTENRQPASGDYLAVPRTSSENRRYLPIGFLPHTTIAANDLQIVPGAGLLEFGLICSAMHMAWVRVTAGRLKSDLRYSTKYTYNTYPWPDVSTDVQKSTIAAAAQAVLDTRAMFPSSILADLYDPLAMPPALLKAHQKLDAAVDAAYAAKRSFKTDAERVAFLFDQYQRITSLLPTAAVAKRARRG